MFGNRRKGIYLQSYFSGCSVARLSRLLWEQEVAGSNPATPTNKTKSFCRKLAYLRERFGFIK